MEKKLMLGNEAVARGLYEAGCRFVSSYPGTPSTEITEFAATYEEMYAEWAPNEKVAVEGAYGACVAGARAFSAMKHVGLNVAADPLFTSSYTGVSGGLVIAVADDQGMHSSQNEQDSRHYARAAKMPMLEPADSQECKDFAINAFELSEKYDTPVLLRMTTRVAHSQSLVSVGPRIQKELIPYQKDIAKRVMMPAMAKGRHHVVEERQKILAQDAETISLNRTEMNGTKIGIVAAGIAYQYAKEAFGGEASYLKLGMIWPLPEQMIRDFASKVDRLIVVEELDDFIEIHLQKMGIACEGKSLFTLEGEYTPEMLRNRICGTEMPAGGEQVPARPPVLCPGCPHRATFHVLKKMGLRVSGDIGCYTLGAAAPLQSIDSCLCMGASVSALHGMDIARRKNVCREYGCCNRRLHVPSFRYDRTAEYRIQPESCNRVDSG